MSLGFSVGISYYLIVGEPIMRETAHRSLGALISFAAAVLMVFGLAGLVHNEFGLSLQIIRKGALLAAGLLIGFLLLTYSDRFGRSK